MWQNWKQANVRAQEQGRVTPAALINPDSPKADEAERKRRLDMCNECPELMATKQCRKCGCFMPAKVQLEHAVCPLGKW